MTSTIPRFAVVLAEQFASFSPKNKLNWSFIHPTEGNFIWEKIDRLVEFAKANDMVVQGQGLISSCCNPDYLLNLTDRTTFRAAVTAHIEAIMR